MLSEKEENMPFIWYKKEDDKRSLQEIIKEEMDVIIKFTHTNGAILFRGFDVDNEISLEECTSGFPGNGLDYVGGNSPRTKLHNKVYTSTEYPPNLFISLHNELSYASSWPKFIFFCCSVPSHTGGSTVIADSRKIYNDLSEELLNEFKTKGVRYIRNLNGGAGAGVSWQKTFETDNKYEVEEHCRLNQIDIKWRSNNSLQLIENRQAIVQHDVSSEWVWFNQADQFHPSTNPPQIYEALMDCYEDDVLSMPQYACFGDGSFIPLEYLDEIREVTRKHSVYFTWNKGDLLVLDNVLTAHGREPFQGERKILVSML
ncbi:hypothetical protein Flavo103_14660 [Flavobacterium collinsii]|jgi:alpha-ketoglutarate-dependent taurine dioxygenase|uniref:TauD/TfdA family dioxygenase n=1 Tax=Flavobacterium collinsii TaxID=1114861 RepID=UPI0022C6DD7A|nr:TauD/TfdA family dioxygenase [Flavobacterium collinsii]GIQ58330.1 hypothetical protein Flavo103_14660 [Flavobacterium collinsii]